MRPRSIRCSGSVRPIPLVQDQSDALSTYDLLNHKFLRTIVCSRVLSRPVAYSCSLAANVSGSVRLLSAELFTSPNLPDERNYFLFNAARATAPGPAVGSAAAAAGSASLHSAPSSPGTYLPHYASKLQASLMVTCSRITRCCLCVCRSVVRRLSCSCGWRGFVAANECVRCRGPGAAAGRGNGFPVAEFADELRQIGGVGIALLCEEAQVFNR